MWRGILALVAGLLFVGGIVGTIVTWEANGWTILAGVGVGLLAWDCHLEERAS